jgi:hypothetical protein
MNGISASQALDLIRTTLNDIPRGKFTQTFALNSYPVCEALFGSGRISSSGGARGRDRQIRLADNESARGTRLYASQAYTQVDVMGTLFEPWIMHEASYVIETGEIHRNAGGARIVDLVKTKRDACYESIANYFERRGILPPDNQADDLNPKGLLFHLRPLGANVVDPVGGFNGTTAIYGDGSTTTLVGTNLDATQTRNNRLRNWVATHGGQVDPLLIRQMRTAVNRVGFKPPKNMKLSGGDTTSTAMFSIMWSELLSEQYADLVNAGPDDRNGNASPFWGDLPFGPVSTKAVPVLNSISYNPIMGVNLNETKCVALEGQWLVEDEPVRSATQRRVIVNGIDTQYTITCDNPRANFLLHTPRSATPF